MAFFKKIREREENPEEVVKKRTGSSGRPLIHAAGGERVDTATSRNYHNPPFMRANRRGHQVYGQKNLLCTKVKV